jgi:chromate transporter
VRGLHRIGSRAVTNRYLLGAAGVGFVAGVAGVSFLVSLFAAGAGYAFLERGRRAPGLALFVVVVALSIGGALVGRTEAAPPTAAATQEHVDPAQLFTTGLRAGALTFGGAYTAIPFVEDDATGPGGWMTTGQFLDGIALSGVIPAPLIIFATFSGYLGGGLVGAVAITTGIFLPAFAITLVGHRQLDALVGNERLHAVLDGVTAGVVGLVAATLVGLAPAAIVGASTLLIFAAALAALYLWQASVAVALVIVAAGAAGVLIGA